MTQSPPVGSFPEEDSYVLASDSGMEIPETQLTQSQGFEHSPLPRNIEHRPCVNKSRLPRSHVHNPSVNSLVNTNIDSSVNSSVNIINNDPHSYDIPNQGNHGNKNYEDKFIF